VTDWLLGNEPIVRASCFAGVFTLIALWEFLRARRQLTLPKGERWLGNLLLVVVDTILLRLLFPVAAMNLAATAEQANWGLLRLAELPYWLSLLLAVVLLDFVMYLQHVMFHAVPLLWRLHVVHHADMDFDVTTGIRFHPLEIILSMLIKLAAVSILGPPVLAVLIFEVLLNMFALFNHGNIYIPLTLDRWLRRLLVTPDMHRVHHSIVKAEYTTNFGANFSCWDRLFGTYLAQPATSHETMEIGLRSFRDSRWLSLPKLLIMPFKQQAKMGGSMRGSF